MKRDLIREIVKELDSYIPEPQEAEIIINANENPYNLPQNIREKIGEVISEETFNRYPDPYSTELRETFSEYIGIPAENIIAGSGVDEILSIISNTFIEPDDIVIVHKPGFAMYKIWTEIAGGQVIEIQEQEDRKINFEQIVQEAIRNNAKIIYICSPNNPTGTTIKIHELQELLESTPSLIVLDETYVDFADENFIDLVNSYDNLIILRTLSKAFRSPAIRCGFGCGPVELIDAMNKVKSPYNLNRLSQDVGKIVIENFDEIEPAIEEIKLRRDRMYEFLDGINAIEVTPSQANYLYFTTPRHKELQKAFLDNGILVRYYPEDEAFRLTIGTHKENEKVKEVIRQVFDK